MKPKRVSVSCTHPSVWGRKRRRRKEKKKKKKKKKDNQLQTSPKCVRAPEASAEVRRLSKHRHLPNSTRYPVYCF
jgi:hypothetical protein